jgi:antitoxin component of MazEF toxin-antitoxin module
MIRVPRRKLFKIGASWAVALPPEWIQAHGIPDKSGREVAIFGDDYLVIIPPKKRDEILKKWEQEAEKEVKKVITELRRCEK